MKLKLLIFLLSVAFIATNGNAQSIFKPLPKLGTHYGVGKFGIASDSTFSGFRITSPVALYALPNSSLYTGIEFGWEHDTWNASTQSWYTNVNISVGAFAGGQFAPTSVMGVTAVGLTVSFFNKLLSVGVLYSLSNKNFQAAAGVSSSLIPNN